MFQDAYSQNMQHLRLPVKVNTAHAQVYTDEEYGPKRLKSILQPALKMLKWIDFPLVSFFEIAKLMASCERILRICTMHKCAPNFFKF